MRADAPGAAAHSARLAFAASAVAKPGGSAVSPPVVQPAGDAPEPGGMDKRCRVRGTGSPGASRTQRAPSSHKERPRGARCTENGSGSPQRGAECGWGWGHLLLLPHTSLSTTACSQPPCLPPASPGPAL